MKSSHNIEGQVVSLAFTPIVLKYLGAPDEAEQIAQRAVALGEVTGNPIAYAGTRAELAQLLGQRGDFDSAFAQARIALEAARQHFPPLVGWTSAVLAGLHLLQSQSAHSPDAAQASLAAAVAIVDDLPHFRELRQRMAYLPAGWTSGALVTGAVRLAAGQFNIATEIAQAFLEDVRRLGLTTLLPEALLLLARIRLATGAPSLALPLLAEAQAHAEAQGNRLALPPILTLLAEINASANLSQG